VDINLNPTITNIFNLLQKNNLNTYLVGGLVRDLLIEKYHKTKILNKDYDIEVFGVSLFDLENLLRTNLDCDITKEGESFAVLKVYTKESEDPIDISIPRTETTTGNKYTDFKVTPDPTLTLEQAGKRRDITINAIYYNPLTLQIIDPFHGVEDIKNKVIRAVNEKTFIEDPLRVLRVMQFAGRFGFEVDKQTINLCKQMIKDNMLALLSKDRVREEFLKFAYKSNFPVISIEFLREIDMLKVYMPEISALQETLQTPEWHPEGNVYNHSLQVTNAGCDIANREGLSNYERATLILSCLYHDSGKALVTIFDEAEKVYRAHGHADKGVQLVINFIQRLNLPNYLAKSLPVLVKYHMHLPVLFYNHKNGQDQTKAFNRIAFKLNKVGADIKLLLWLVEADRRGRKPNPSHPAKVPLHGETTAEPVSTYTDLPLPTQTSAQAGKCADREFSPWSFPWKRESTPTRHSGLDPESSLLLQFEPFPKSFMPEFSELELWFNDTVEKLQQSKVLEKELITGNQVLDVIDKKQGIWVGAVKEFIKDLYLTKEYVESKSRVELYTAEGNVQDFVVKQIYEYLESVELSSMKNPSNACGTWKRVVEDEDYRDKLLEEFISK